MQALPEFFCGKFPHKSPETYSSYRNFIIKLYRENPNSYLSAIICRKSLPGDVCSVIRLHAFLEHWGLINFNVDPMLKPPKVNLSGSGLVDQNLIDIATKGYLKVGEAENLAQLYSIKPEYYQNASDHTFLIAASKINLISSYKRPSCNFCGNICGQYWYQKKVNSNSIFAKEEEYLKGMGEQDSLYSVLKQLSSTYLICCDCFKLSNFPKILR
eukprot:CAMPEP_0170567850 /NCGR_PEP_ID=MMETSP0211-20121228/80750_1 /TAXON_ID=311385 /ORGANISM="Pseudokeronopsis sp., Strain OXSARD2" /LENGTH=213 /DNA_ID=CAMNT_0010889433 /DNA_START=417 /DNA_END=1061 /DNA_ORIENTATION=-